MGWSDRPDLTEWRIGHGLTLDCQIGPGLTLDWRMGDQLADLSRIEIGLADW